MIIWEMLQGLCVVRPMPQAFATTGPWSTGTALYSLGMELLGWHALLGT